MTISKLQINDDNFELTYEATNSGDIKILSEILSSVVCANYQKLSVFDHLKFPLGHHSLLYNPETDRVSTVIPI